jgi:hypothetical protein
MASMFVSEVTRKYNVGAEARWQGRYASVIVHGKVSRFGSLQQTASSYDMRFVEKPNEEAYIFRYEPDSGGR